MHKDPPEVSSSSWSVSRRQSLWVVKSARTQTRTASPTSSPEDSGSYDRGNSSTLIFYIVVAGLALLAVGGILIYLIIVNSRRGKGDDD